MILGWSCGCKLILESNLWISGQFGLQVNVIKISRTPNGYKLPFHQNKVIPWTSDFQHNLTVAPLFTCVDPSVFTSYSVSFKLQYLETLSFLWLLRIKLSLSDSIIVNPSTKNLLNQPHWPHQSMSFIGSGLSSKCKPFYNCKPIPLAYFIFFLFLYEAVQVYNHLRRMETKVDTDTLDNLDETH